MDSLGTHLRLCVLLLGRAVSDDPSVVVATYAILVFLQEVGNILTGPIISGLISQNTSLGTYGIEKYETLVIFQDCMFLSALVIGLWYLMPRKMGWAEFSRTPFP